MSDKTLVVPGEIPDATQFKSRSLAILETAKALVIENDEQQQEVADWIRDIKSSRADLDALCDPAIEAAHMEHKARLNVKKQYAVPLEQAEVIAKEKMAAFKKKRDAELEAIRLENERKAREQERIEREAREKKEREAREKWEKEQAALRAKEEKERKAAAEKAEKLAAEGKAEEAAKAKAKADADAKAAKERAEKDAAKRAEDEARARADADAKAEADRLARQKAAKDAEAAAKTTGTSFTVVYLASVDTPTDLRDLLAAIVAGKVPVAAVQPNEKWLNDYAKATQGAVAMPGVRFYTKDQVSVKK